MTFGPLEPKFFMNFCVAIDRQDLMMHQFGATTEDSEPYQEFCRIFKSKTQAQWVDLLKDVDACCEPVLNLSEVWPSSIHLEV